MDETYSSREDFAIFDSSQGQSSYPGAVENYCTRVGSKGIVDVAENPSMDLNSKLRSFGL